MIKLTITGEPVAKGRHRQGKFGSYTPEKTVNYETLVKYCFQSEYPNFEPFKQHVPLRLDITAYFRIPQSESKKKQELMRGGQIRPTKKPDRDNIEKIICDSLNGVAFYDDSQIVEGETAKFYSENPRVEIRIKEI